MPDFLSGILFNRKGYEEMYFSLFEFCFISN
ncbi:hypothetical protein Murru_1155 [Allomuricauda ruestringensis DSM 13258]|uniref:Uncharacterized protein n=1 Tax=Allomuricauda ruestringensis (strain DSM 13258 / CIP 107369 / LMG 19739 / B1) TaxID=886377 RepID=G2PN75_ALLRU|nr:hypothetical protein Murru_1155 [Allomuricauda ruestringensis DSM 13258]